MDALVRLPHGPGKLKAVHLRHHDVRNDEVIQTVVHLVIGIPGVPAAAGLKAAVAEIGADQLVQLGIVLRLEEITAKAAVPSTMTHTAKAVQAVMTSRKCA